MQSVRNKNSTLKSNYFHDLCNNDCQLHFFSPEWNETKEKKKIEREDGDYRNLGERNCYIVTNSKDPDKQFPKTTHEGSLPTITLLDITTTSVISQHSQQIGTVI